MAKKKKDEGVEIVTPDDVDFSQPIEVDPTSDELFGIGMKQLPNGKFFAYRISSKGMIEVLTPPRKGQFPSESAASATGRVLTAVRIQALEWKERKKK